MVAVRTVSSDGSGEVLGLFRIPLASAKYMDGLPQHVSADRDEAWQAFNGGLNKGACLLARSALEGAARHMEAKGSVLRERIDRLADDGIITRKLAEWAHEVRATGNEAAHEMRAVSDEDADASLYFLDSFLEDVYSVPFRQQERAKAREARRAESAESQSG